MHPAIAWIVANPYESAGLLYLALGALNAILPHKGDDAGPLRRALDWLAPLVPAKFSGTLKPPLRPSKRDDDDAPPTVPPSAVLAMVALLSGCAPAWQTGAALVKAANELRASYSEWTDAERQKIASAHPECLASMACAEAALAPFEAKQAPVLACMAALVPLAAGVEDATKAKDAKALASALPGLAAKTPVCVAEIEKARR